MELPLALVTGAARGIGHGISEALAADGFRVLRVDTAADSSPDSVTADISTPEGRGAILEAVESSGGSLSVLVNNAGVSPRQRVDVTESSQESFDRLMTINARGPHFLTQALVPALRRGAATAGPQGRAGADGGASQ